MKAYKNNSKAFLTDHPQEDSTVMWEVETSSSEVMADLAIRDCYKRIDINFYIGEDYPLEHRIDKVSCLISELIKFQRSMVIADSQYQLLKNLKKFEEKK